MTIDYAPGLWLIEDRERGTNFGLVEGEGWNQTIKLTWVGPILLHSGYGGQHSRVWFTLLRRMESWSDVAKEFAEIQATEHIKGTW